MRNSKIAHWLGLGNGPSTGSELGLHAPRRVIQDQRKQPHQSNTFGTQRDCKYARRVPSSVASGLTADVAERLKAAQASGMLLEDDAWKMHLHWDVTW